MIAPSPASAKRGATALASRTKRCRVERDDPRDVVGRLLDEASAHARPGVVDENPDSERRRAAASLPPQARRPGQISLDDVDGHAAFLAQTGRQSLHSRLVAGNEHEVVAAAREALGIGGADAGGGAGDED